MSKQARYRAFSFTWNNYTDESEPRLKALEYKYLVYGKEVGAAGTPHLQGMITFSNAKTLSSAIKALPGCHVEVAKDPPALAEYCKKDGDVYEDGTPPVSKKEQGDAEQARWKRARELATSGNMEEIDDDLYVRYYSTFKKIKQDHMVIPASIATLDFHWFCGPSGTGKSKTARELYPDAYIKNSNKWWDGYAGQDAVIIEEWDPKLDWGASFLKKWADHYAFNAEVKGGTMMARPKTIVVTSNYTIKDCFPDARDWEPLERRFKVREFSSPNPHLFDPTYWNKIRGDVE